MKRKTNTRGGKRPGAGRKKSTDPITTYNIHITIAQANLLKLWGGGNISQGLRWLIDTSKPLVSKCYGCSPFIG